MLTSDLVSVRRRGDVLSVPPLSPGERARALELAEVFVGLARAGVGGDRASLLDTWRSVPVSSRERKLAAGLQKLLLDRAVFEQDAALEPAALRVKIFARAAARRRESVGGAPAAFDRGALVEEVGRDHGVAADAIERALYADLPDAQVLRAVDVAGPRALVAAYETARVQAVLLRAVKVIAHVRDRTPSTYRQLFRRLKFRRLLHRITPLGAERASGAKPGHAHPGYRIEIDGPYSLFDSVTKYGLQLALAYPALTACASWTIEAELRWGPDRRPLRFVHKGGTDPEGDRHGSQDDGDRSQDAGLPDEVAELLARINEAGAGWRAEVSATILDLPGVGLCVPDLELRREADGARVQVEVLGFWSRDAVWKRVELVESGLETPVVFAVSKHLRVSEAALPETLPAALYVYAHTLSASALLERADAVVDTYTHLVSR